MLSFNGEIDCSLLTTPHSPRPAGNAGNNISSSWKAWAHNGLQNCMGRDASMKWFGKLMAICRCYFRSAAAPYRPRCRFPVFIQFASSYVLPRSGISPQSPGVAVAIGAYHEKPFTCGDRLIIERLLRRKSICLNINSSGSGPCNVLRRKHSSVKV